jgi:hypothetical protein
VITQVHQAMPERAISQLCNLLQVSRSWYYEQQTRAEEEEAGVELRDAIERIILDFPGYGYRLASLMHSSELGGSSTTSACCGLCAKSRYCAT